MLYNKEKKYFGSKWEYKPNYLLLISINRESVKLKNKVKIE
jgi:hypothetical protein